MSTVLYRVKKEIFKQSNLKCLWSIEAHSDSGQTVKAEEKVK